MARFSGMAQTVLGPVDPNSLGLTLMHEHLLIDAIGASSSPGVTASERAKWLEPLTLSNYYDQRRNTHLYRHNHMLLSIDEAVQEAGFFKASGGSSIVDVTSGGLARDPIGLASIARLSGLHVIMGAGFYTADFHPTRLASMTVEEIADEIAFDLLEGVPDHTPASGILGIVREDREWANTGIQAGIIGEIGLSWPVHPDELKVLNAAAKAQQATGASITIHPGRDAKAPFDAVRAVEAAGGDLSRTIIGHLDRTLFEVSAMLELAKTGCVLQFDLFGLQDSFYQLASVDMPNDGTRVNYLVELSEAGYLQQLLISQDIDVRVRFRQFGGEGWEHIPSRILLLMRRKGFTVQDVQQIVRWTPARLLTIN